MAIHFHTLTIAEVKKETADCISVAFDIPAELKSIFKFIQGQNITLKTYIDNEEIRRTYSICSSPIENEMRVAIKKAPYGLFSTYANNTFKPGDEIGVLPPTGKFYTNADSANSKKYLAFAAGSGITPIIANIKILLATETSSTFTLVYANHNRQSIIFFEELERLKNKYINRFNLIHIISREQSGSPINSGRINKEKLVQLGKIIDYQSIDDIFICGPQDLLFLIKDFLEADSSIDKKKIHFELFSSPGAKQQVEIKKEKVAINTNGLSKVSIIADGRQHNFTMAFEGESILNTALQKGIDLPFACKGGMCCSCKALIKEGKVSMDVHWGLEQEDIDQHYVLTCQAHPLTDAVVIDFDTK